MTPGSYAIFPRGLHENGPSRVIPLDLGRGRDALVSVAAGLALSTSFLRLRPREPVATHAQATAELYYVLRGIGRSRAKDRALEWRQGDCFLLPSGQTAVHASSEDSALFWVHDEPWLSEIGGCAPRSRFEPTVVRAEGRNVASVDEASDPAEVGPWSLSRGLPDPLARGRSGDQAATLRSMFHLLPEGQTRRPRRSRSTTLHLVLDCQPGCSTLIGKRLDEQGCIMDPVCIDWKPASVVAVAAHTWLVHVNNTKSEACLMPLEIPGLRTAVDARDRDPGGPFLRPQVNLEASLDRREP